MNAPRMLLPLALAQGLWVLARTPRLPAPAGTHGRAGSGSGPAMRVIGVGDSIMAGTGVRQQCDSLTASYARHLQRRLRRDVEWGVHGENGATSATILHRIAPGVPAADIYLVSAGVNDATRGIEPSRYGRNLDRLFRLLRRKSPESTVLFGGVPALDRFPALPWPLSAVLAERGRLLQQAAEAVATQHERVLCFRFPDDMPVEEFASDGFHPAEFACSRWAEHLLELWPANGANPPPEPVRRTARGLRVRRADPSPMQLQPRSN